MSAKLRYLYRAWRYRLFVDPAELRFVRRHLQPGQVAVDVGCHKGAYTYWLERWVGAAGEVIAFEPQPRQAEYLQQMFRSMDYSNVTLVPSGLSDRSDRLRLHSPTAHGEPHEATFVTAAAQPACATIEVEVTTLDEHFATLGTGRTS